MAGLGPYLRAWIGAHVDEQGQDFIEYLVLAAVISLVVIGGVALFADEVQDWFVSAGLWFRGGSPPPPPGP